MNLTSPLKSTTAQAALGFGLGALLWMASPGQAAELIQPRVMVVATYETGRDQGDIPGELQYWVERQHLNQSIQVPGIEHAILTNGKGLYAMVSGTGSRCALQLMALAMDPRFDLRKTYFLLNGIAGADPAQTSLASAAWIKQVVDGDPGFAIDSREIPTSWPYGLIAPGAMAPNQAPPNIDSFLAAGFPTGGTSRTKEVIDFNASSRQMAVKMNAPLCDWAYHLTLGTAIPDDDAVAKVRARFKSFPAAQLPPRVLETTSLGTDHYWHGTILNQWAQDWVRIYTQGKGTFAITDCEDQGFGAAMEKLSLLGRVDFNRCLILRTVAGFSVPLPGVTAEKSLFGGEVVAAAYLPSLEAAYRVGDVVVDNLLAHWQTYASHVPGS